MADEATMNAIAIEITNALADRLTQEHGRHTSALATSILGGWRIDGDDIVISMEDYAEYLEYGTPNPTTPEEILQWVKDKIVPELKGKHKVDEAQKIAESMAKHITKYGPRPYPFVRNTIKEDIPRILRKYI